MDEVEVPADSTWEQEDGNGKVAIVDDVGTDSGSGNSWVEFCDGLGRHRWSKEEFLELYPNQVQ